MDVYNYDNIVPLKKWFLFDPDEIGMDFGHQIEMGMDLDHKMNDPNHRQYPF